MRKAIAQAMVGSAFTAPHVTEFVTVDVTRTMKLVAELKEDKDMAGVRVNPLLIIAKALLVAIKRNPDVNAAWDEANQEIVAEALRQPGHRRRHPARSDRAEHQGRARQDPARSWREAAGRAGLHGTGGQDVPGGHGRAAR